VSSVEPQTAFGDFSGSKKMFKFRTINSSPTREFFTANNPRIFERKKKTQCPMHGCSRSEVPSLLSNQLWIPHGFLSSSFEGTPGTWWARRGEG